MDQTLTALERAFELAKSGRFATVAEVRQQVSREGYSAAQITGSALSRQLNGLIKAARPQVPAEDLAEDENPSSD